ncbi:MAG: uracil-DNA glycosylase [Pseudomonadota bacterium]
MTSWHEDLAAYLDYQVRLGFSPILLPGYGRMPGLGSEDEAKREYSVESLAAIRSEIGDCTRCTLHKGRTNIVFGEGRSDADLMFVGDAPGVDEDVQGRHFVGEAGLLLTKMIRAMGLERSDVYITDAVKCRPPGSRQPERTETDTCVPFLEKQIEAVGPQVIVTLGEIPAETLLGLEGPVSTIRGSFLYWRGIPVMPTYHPSFLLMEQHNRRWKAEAWTDLKAVMALLGLPRPEPGGKT